MDAVLAHELRRIRKGSTLSGTVSSASWISRFSSTPAFAGSRGRFGASVKSPPIYWRFRSRVTRSHWPGARIGGPPSRWSSNAEPRWCSVSRSRSQTSSSNSGVTRHDAFTPPFSALAVRGFLVGGGSCSGNLLGRVRSEQRAPRQEAQPVSQGPLVFSIACEEFRGQISYDVRIIETEPDILRQLFDRKPVSNQGKIGQWLIDGNHSNIVNKIMARPTSSMSIAPKATTFEGQHLVIRAGRKAQGPVPPRTTIKLCGMLLPDGVRMSFEVTDPTNRKPQQKPAVQEEEVERPLKESFVLQGSSSLRDGWSLILDLDSPLRSIEKDNVASQRLIVITPRRIILEEEEVTIGHDRPAKPAAHLEKP